MKRRQLKNYLLFPFIQLKLVLLTLVTVAITVGFTFYQINSSFNHLTGIGQRIGLNQSSSYFKLLEMQRELIIKNSLIALALAVLVSLVLNLIVTHRALGPFYRLKVFFKHYKKGSGERIRFRETDYFKDLEADINRAIEEDNK